MKKLDGKIAEVIKGIIDDGDTVIEIDGRRYYVHLTEESETTVKEDVEADSELKRKLNQAKKNISDGKTYTTEEVFEMIDQGEL